MDITATLKNARIIETREGNFTISGDIYGDVHKRWEDGSHVYSSFITEKLPNDTFTTRSGNTYKVENWRGRDH